MDEITIEMSPRISRGLGHEKVRSFVRSGLGLGHHIGYIMSQPLLAPL